MNLFDINEHACGNADEFQINGKRNVLLHRTTHKSNFATAFHGSFDHLLHTVNMAGETCGNDAAIAMFVEQLTQHGANTSLAWRMAMLFGISGVTHEQTNAHSRRQFTKTG